MNNTGILSTLEKSMMDVPMLLRDNLGENGGGDQNGKRRPVAAL
jgi:hypothetical protein